MTFPQLAYTLFVALHLSSKFKLSIGMEVEFFTKKWNPMVIRNVAWHLPTTSFVSKLSAIYLQLPVMMNVGTTLTFFPFPYSRDLFVRSISQAILHTQSCQIVPNYTTYWLFLYPKNEVWGMSFFLPLYQSPVVIEATWGGGFYLYWTLCQWTALKLTFCCIRANKDFCIFRKKIPRVCQIVDWPKLVNLMWFVVLNRFKWGSDVKYT